MKLRDILFKLKRRGIKGAIGFVRIRLNERHARQFYIDNARNHSNSNTLPGITFIGDFFNKGSGGKVCRDFILSLHDAGITFQAAFKNENSVDPSGKSTEKLISTRKNFNINRFSHVIEYYNSVIPIGLIKNHAQIIFWEFESGFLEFYPSYAGPSTVITMSDFNYSYLRRILPSTTPVKKILYPFRPYTGELETPALTRKRFNIPINAFAVFYNFDFESGYHRKNPYGALRAFTQAFNNEENASLVFKVAHEDQHSDRFNELMNLAEGLGVKNKLIFISGYLSELDIYSITNACDCYLSLHRGEGFGLGIAEAMSIGKPVIVTDYGGTTEFCNHNNSIPVPYKLVPVSNHQKDNTAYAHVKEWADPDIDFAASALKDCFTFPALRIQLGTSAKKTLKEHFSIVNFRKSIYDFLSN